MWTSIEYKLHPKLNKDGRSDICIIIANSHAEHGYTGRAFYFSGTWRCTISGNVLGDVDYWIIEKDLIDCVANI